MWRGKTREEGRGEGEIAQNVQLPHPDRQAMSDLPINVTLARARERCIGSAFTRTGFPEKVLAGNEANELHSCAISRAFLPAPIHSDPR